MEGHFINKQDTSTRNEHVDKTPTDKGPLEYKGTDKFSRTIKEKGTSHASVSREDSTNQTPKLVGLTKLVSAILIY